MTSNPASKYWVTHPEPINPAPMMATLLKDSWSRGAGIGIVRHNARNIR